MLTFRRPARRLAAALVTLSLVLTAACASGPVPRGEGHNIDTPRPQPAPAGLVGLERVARDHGLRLSSGPERVRLERNGRRAEIARSSRVAYIDGDLVLMPAVPENREGRLYVDPAFARKLAGWARLASRPLPAPPKPRPVKTPTPREPVVARVPAPDTTRPLSRLRVMIDAGHGGKDPGAIARSGLQEKAVALDVALELRDRLRNAGAEVLMTRSDDRFVSLDGRAARSSRANIDAFVSIHANAAKNRRARGVEVFRARQRRSGHRADKLSESTRLARSLYARLERISPHGDRGVKDSPGYRVLKGNRHPSALVELGFLSNTGEAKLLDQVGYRRRLAQALVDGLNDYARGL